MPVNYAISTKKRSVQQYIESKYQLETATLSNIDSFLTTSIYGIIALKIWRERLQDQPNPEVNIYLDETSVSNGGY